MQVFNPNDPNVVMLEQVARSLGPELCSQLVFVGGAAPGLLITDLALPAIRRTDDVDIGTKLEAFYGRGGGDYLFSHDMGDIISVIDGRASLLNECQDSLLPLRVYLAAQFQHLLTDRRSVDALPGHLPPDASSQARLPDLMVKIQRIAELSTP